PRAAPMSESVLNRAARLQQPPLTVKLKRTAEIRAGRSHSRRGRSCWSNGYARLSKTEGPRLVGDSQGPLGQGGTGLPSRSAQPFYSDSQLSGAIIFSATASAGA